MNPSTPPPGRDTATGTDPDAKYVTPGYEDKSFGQAVDQDQRLVDELVADAHGDLAQAEAAFDQRSAGSPALARQREERQAREDRQARDDHRTGEQQARQNREVDPPA